MTTVALVGDVMLGRGVNAALRTLRPEQPWTRTPKVFHFRADYSAIEVLRAARVDCCSLANNHTLDFEERGLLDTMEHLKAVGIRYAGAGLDREEAARPVLLTAPSDRPTRIAILAFTDNEPPFAAGSDRPGTNYLPVSLEPKVLHRIAAAVAAAREAGAEAVVFSNHWGPNMVQRPSALFRRFARAVIDRGADVYYGHSAHVFQGVEIYRGKPILYDTGDFIDDYAVDPRLRNDRSFLFRISLEGSEFRRLELFPVALSYARAQLAKGSERESILDQMERLSGEMGTTFVRREGRLVFEEYS